MKHSIQHLFTSDAATGCQCLDAITEEDVLSFFLAEDGSLQRSCSYKKNIAAVFKAGLNWKAAQCRKVLSFLLVLRENRKNIQYLTQDEVRLLREAAEKGEVSARNRAILFLLLFTGLRGCDIAGLTFHSIDWETERILVTQQKTSVPLELPLSAVVGNAIYDYLESERPDTGLSPPVPDRNTSLFTIVYPGNCKHRNKNLSDCRSAAESRRQEGDTHLPA